MSFHHSIYTFKVQFSKRLSYNNSVYNLKIIYCYDIHIKDKSIPVEFFCL